MLCEFRVNNFKSLINIDYKIALVNLLLGANNSGKTNLCQALRLFSRTAEKWSLPNIANDMALGNVPNVYFTQPAVDLECVCKLFVAGEDLTFNYRLNLGVFAKMAGGLSMILGEQLQVSGGVFGPQPVVLLEGYANKVRLLDEELFSTGVSLDTCYRNITIESHLAGVTMLSQLYSWNNPRACAFREYLANWKYYDLVPQGMQSWKFDPQANFLDEHGTNLVSALFALKNQDERRYRRLVELMQPIEKRLDAINFITAGQHIDMQFTDSQDHRFELHNISSGTLRFLALCYIILNNARQKNPPLTIIEEPENGLYVRYLKQVFELIDPNGSGGQYIFTSHSPYFIDLFDNSLEAITIMQNKGAYSALVKPDPAQVRKYLDEMPLGELHFREMLA